MTFCIPYDCKNVLNEVVDVVPLTLLRVSGHNGIPGNEKADWLCLWRCQLTLAKALSKDGYRGLC